MPALAAQPVDRLAPRRDGEPRAGVLGNAGARPRHERRVERVVERVLREVDVAQVADQRRDDAPVLGAEDRLERSYISQTGRTSIEPCSAAGIFAAYCERLVDVLALEDVVAAELLLRLRERPVGDERLAVADADGRRGGDWAGAGRR